MKHSRILTVACALVVSSATASAEPITKLRFESTFPASGLLFESSKYFTERVKAMSGARLQIEMLPPDAVVPPFEVLDAVHKGAIGRTRAGSDQIANALLDLIGER